MKYNKYKNIFNYYRGQNLSKGDSDEHYNKQIEDNTTKAFINTLEYLTDATKKEVLKKMGIQTKRIKGFDLQPSFTGSRPDAVIKTQETDYFIESKVGSTLDIMQLINHLKNIGPDAVLFVITNNSNDFEIIKKNELCIKYFSWNNIWQIFNDIKTQNPTDSFLINQFLIYLEDNNMSEFNGWKQKDFDAFLFIEKDEKEESRKYVKSRFNSFMLKLKPVLDEINEYPDFDTVIKTPLKGATCIWGNFVEIKKKNINIAHFWINISSSGIDIGINSEGKESTAPFIKKLYSNTNIFISICKDLEDYILEFKKRSYKRIRVYDAITMAKINLGKHFSEYDAQYLINKIKEADNMVEFTFYKHFDRDNNALKDDNVINIFKAEFVKLAELYRFNQK